MLVWIVYFKDAAQYNKSYIEFYMEEGKKLGITVRLILVEDIEFGVENGVLFLRVAGETLSNPDAVIMRAIYPLLSRHMEGMGLKVFNNAFVSEICNDKARTYQYLAGTGIRMVDSGFYKNGLIKNALANINSKTSIEDTFTNINDGSAIKSTLINKGRVVIKAVDGHGGQQVFLLDGKKQKTGKSGSGYDDGSSNYVDNSKHINGNCGDDHINSKCIDVHTDEKCDDENIKHIIDGIGSSDTVVQLFIGSRHQDLRVYVIGKEIIAAVLRTSKEGFRANYSLGGEVSLYELSEAEKSIVGKITDKFDFGLAGIDFIIGDDGELIFNEIEDVVGSRMLYRCSDINIVELYLKYILQQL